MTKLDNNNPASVAHSDADVQQVEEPDFNASICDMDVTNKKTKRAAHAKVGQSAYLQKSTRMRKILIVVIIFLVALCAALVFYFTHMVSTAQNAAQQQTNVTEVDTKSIENAESEKNIQASSKKTTVPELISLFGLNVDAAIIKIGHGAEATRIIEVNEADSPIKKEVELALTEEPSDTRSGTPTVYLSLDEGGMIIQVGYSASTSSLGYGTLSFSDAVTNEHVVEKTLESAGLNVDVGTVILPTDKSTYSTFDTDGTTLIKEYFKFEGQGLSNGQQYKWESVLSYDYSMANATDNLNDTIRTIYIYISK